ncbi:hypothetical protein [Pseudomonas lactucae]|uniref:hypothetical protein n=1 Tax=Pseudomonas lactucae TaxID=2813360 RepID=UPI002FCCCA23
MSSIKMYGTNVRGNGGPGIVQIGSNLKFESHGGDISNNLGPGLIQREHSLVEKLGLPAETDPKELAELLKILLPLPNEARRAKVAESGLFNKIKAFALDSSTLMSNITTVASNPQVQQIIQALSVQAN